MKRAHSYRLSGPLAVLSLILTSPVSVEAASTLTDVTPATIAAQPFGFRVETESNENGSVRFDVFVSTGRDSLSPRREGRLEITREDVVKKQPGKNLPVQHVVLWTSVREVNEGDTLHFSFGVPREMLKKASFQFRNYDPNGMPAMDVFRFIIAEFAKAP